MKRDLNYLAFAKTMGNKRLPAGDDRALKKSYDPDAAIAS